MHKKTIFLVLFYIMGCVGFVVLPEIGHPGPRVHHEVVYQEIWCDGMGGKTEVILKEGSRVDCVTEHYAVEFDFADKWKEAPGQAVLYAIETGLNPGIVIIVEDPDRDEKYIRRINKVLDSLKYKNPNNPPKKDKRGHIEMWIMCPRTLPNHKSKVCESQTHSVHTPID